MNSCRTKECPGGGAKPVAPFVVEMLSTPGGPVGKIDHDWSWRDRFGALRMRLDIGRMNYAVPPGLYASGTPSRSSPVLVTANYKLTVDHVRRAIRGMDAWLLVLDTKGVNVWCAAGKGTFGTDELVHRVVSCRLSGLVDHRTLIVPQLGAPGIAAHEVAKRSGFRVVYGPVRAVDLPRFVADGMKATPEMRTVTFNSKERLAVAPVELVHWSKWLLVVLAVGLVAAAVGAGDYSIDHVIRAATRLILVFFCGAILGPLLFPWLPGRAFALKGMFCGILTVAIMASAGLLPMRNPTETLQSCGWILLTLSIASFLLLMYTGSSPYTSSSGTRLETKIGFRLQCSAAIAGMVLLLFPLWLK